MGIMRNLGLKAFVSVLAVLAAVATTAGGCGEVTREEPGGAVEGVFQIVVSTDFDTKTETKEYYLKRADESLLRLMFETIPQVTSNTRVAVSGTYLSPNWLQVQHLQALRSSEMGVEVVRSPLSSAAPVKKKVAVVMLNFQNDASTPKTQDTMRTMVFTGPHSASAYFKEASYGLVELTGKVRTDGDVYGWYTLPVGNDGLNPDGTRCPWGQWVDMARNLAQAGGYDPAGYDHTVFYWPYTTNCSFGGVAPFGGNMTASNGHDEEVIVHEIGHNWDLDHSEALECRDTAGNPVALSPTCTQRGYGDPFCVMGDSYKYWHFNAIQKGRLGWLSPANMATLEVDGTRTIVPQEIPSSGIQSLRIPRDGDTYFYVEARRGVGFDSTLPASAANGVLIRVAQDYRIRHMPLLIDNHPVGVDWENKQVFTDAALTVGETFTEPRRGVSIRLDSVTSAGATVTVDVPTPDTGDGTGIKAEYFPSMDLTGTPVVRTDPAVVFDWGPGAPAPGLPVDGFSARWTGQLKPRYSETYTFSTWSDDGIRVWVNNQLIVDAWTNHSPQQDQGTIALVAGNRYDVRVEYFENSGGATAKLFWTSPSQLREIVPRTRLYPAGASCTAETNAAFCTRLGKNCGTVSGADNCGTARTVTSCGSCTAPQTCSGGGTANVCGGGTVAPGLPTAPAPGDQATGVSTSVVLRWTAGANTTAHDVYFGTATTPPLVVSQATTTSYTPPTLQPNTTYFWRIVERNGSATTSGPTWRFTTATVAGPLLSDNFESGTAGNWTPLSGTWAVGTDGSRVYTQSNSSNNARSVAGATTWTDQIVSARVKPLVFNGTDRFVAVLARVQDANNYYYVTLRSSGRLELKRLVAGAATNLASKAFAVAANSWYTVRLEVVGSTLRAYVNGTLQLSATDTRFTAGRAGLATYFATASFDDVTVTR